MFVTKPDDPYGLNSLDRVLDRELAQALRDSPDVPTLHKIRRRRSFGFGMLFLSVFCIGVAAVPWPSKGPWDVAMWLLFGATLLCIGAWEIDKAAKEEERASKLLSELGNPDKTDPPVSGVRRIR